MKKFACVALSLAALCMAACFSACKEMGEEGEEEKATEFLARQSLSKSMIVFDEQEFSPDNAYATVYFGADFSDPRTWDIYIDSYSYALFYEGTRSDFNRDFGYGWRDYDKGVAIFDEIISKPHDEMSTVSSLLKPVLIIHGERGAEGYLSNKYGLDEIYQDGKAMSVKFLYSEHIKLPKELFEKEQGQFSFIYNVPTGLEDHEGNRWFNGSPSEEENVTVTYEKKDGMVTLENKVVYDRKMFSKVKFLDLEEE